MDFKLLPWGAGFCFLVHVLDLSHISCFFFLFSYYCIDLLDSVDWCRVLDYHNISSEDCKKDAPSKPVKPCVSLSDFLDRKLNKTTRPPIQVFNIWGSSIYIYLFDDPSFITIYEKLSLKPLNWDLVTGKTDVFFISHCWVDSWSEGIQTRGIQGWFASQWSCFPTI